MDKFYAVRQARTLVIGSRMMTRDEAAREVTAWRAEIGPACTVPVTEQSTRAVNSGDQQALMQAEGFGRYVLADPLPEMPAGFYPSNAVPPF